MSNETNNVDAKIINRIKNLLDMANDTGSPAEAMIAAKRARSLMDQYQVKADDLKSEENMFGEESFNSSSTQLATWLSILLTAVAKFNDCATVEARRDINRGGKMNLVFKGFKSDAIIAKYTAEYLIDCCERSLKRENIKGRSPMNMFRVAFSQEVHSRMMEIIDARTKTVRTTAGKSLVIQKTALVEQHFHNPRLVKRPSAGSRRPATKEELEAKLAGKEAGANASFNKHVAGKEQLRLS